jgi:hypothetical protein
MVTSDATFSEEVGRLHEVVEARRDEAESQLKLRETSDYPNEKRSEEKS